MNSLVLYRGYNNMKIARENKLEKTAYKQTTHDQHATVTSIDFCCYNFRKQFFYW